jgi:thiamine-phosphate pyrophosphorylase
VRLHAIVDDLETARAAVDGGATVLQLRLKGATTDEVVELGRPFRRLAEEAGLVFVVNDDVDAAIELRADGVHLGRDDEGVELAIRTQLLLGRSAATPEEAVAAAKTGASYIGAGPVWATPSKQDADPPIGLDGLRSIAEAVSIPVIAIGGVDASNAPACIGAGATGVAVIRAAADAARISAAL